MRWRYLNVLELYSAVSTFDVLLLMQPLHSIIAIETLTGNSGLLVVSLFMGFKNRDPRTELYINVLKPN